ncbi:hypothetical protein D6D01_02239 [Aureobasidium pullulans]|uniref:Uncharacterized protein n=1 Tax=Aureobasidium pullulans TaxID=5580 RepID=A0A4S9LUF9_AURPU|nr:hypothetical protein D6D01_02239 [Aureobasidium pullulans]
MAPQQIYCQICGGPILSRSVKLMDNTPEVSDKIDGVSRNNHNTWLKGAVALTTEYRTQDGVEVDTYYPLILDVCGFGLDSQHSPKDTDRVVLRFDASYDFDLGPHFQLSEWDEEVELNSLSVCGSLYLPAHDACMRLTERFVDTTPTPDQAAVTSIIKLWDVLCRRVDQVSGHTMTAEPHNFFEEPNSRSYTRWGPSPYRDASTHTLLEANPLDIPQITQSILDNLKPALDMTQAQIERQDQFCNTLVEGRNVPWLWDIDTGFVRSRQESGSWAGCETTRHCSSHHLCAIVEESGAFSRKPELVISQLLANQSRPTCLG